MTEWNVGKEQQSVQMSSVIAVIPTSRVYGILKMYTFIGKVTESKHQWLCASKSTQKCASSKLLHIKKRRNLQF